MKLNFSLDTVFKIVDALGGVLVFPWDKDDDDTIYMKAGKLEEELATAKNEIAELKIELKPAKRLAKDLKILSGIKCRLIQKCRRQAGKIKAPRPKG